MLLVGTASIGAVLPVHRTFLVLLLTLMPIYPDGFAAAQPTVPGDLIVQPSRDLPRLEFRQDRRLESESVEWTTPVNHMGMTIMYRAVTWFIDRIQPNEFPSHLLSDDDLQSIDSLWRSVKHNYIEWLSYEQGYLVVAGVSLFLAVIFTLGALLYACCRCCCCRRDGKVRTDGKRDSCRRQFWSLVLALFSVVMILAVVCAFISNQYTHDAANQLPDRLESGLENLTQYRTITVQQLKKLLVEDFDSLRTIVNESLNSSAAIIVDRVKETTGAVSLDRLADIFEKAREIEMRLSYIYMGMEQLRTGAVKLTQELQRLRSDVLNMAEKCLQDTTDPNTRSQCSKVKQIVEEHIIIPNFEVVFRLDALKENVSRIVNARLSDRLREGMKQFTDWQGQIDQHIQRSKKEVMKQLSDIGTELRNTSMQIDRSVQQFDVTDATRLINENREDFEKAEFYRWVGSLCMCSIMGLMALCFVFGLCYGVCGKAPDYYEEDCCNRNVGSKFLCCGIVLGVLFVLLFMVITVGLFLIGGNGESILCRAAKDPTHHQGVVKLVQRYLDLQKRSRRNILGSVQEFLGTHVAQDVLQGCAQNKTLFTILELDKKYGLTMLEQYRDRARRAVERLSQDVDSLALNMNEKQLISDQVKAELYKIQETNLGVPTDRVQWARSQQAQLNLVGGIQELESVDWRDQRLQKVVVEAVTKLKQLNDSDASALNATLFALVANLTFLNENLPNLTAEIPHLVAVVENAQGLLRNNLTGFVRQKALDLAKDLLFYADQYISHLEYEMRNNITSCEPLRRLGGSTVVAVCDCTLYPFNGYWAAIGVCLLLSIPSLLIASALRDLYGQMNNYTASDYSDSELVPLNGTTNYYTSNTGSRHNSARRVRDYDRASTARIKHANAAAAANANNYANWRTSTNQTYFDDVGTPPPPYANGQHHR